MTGLVEKQAHTYNTTQATKTIYITEYKNSHITIE
jgi:hypothetical protein